MPAPYNFTIQLDLADDKMRSQFKSLLGDFAKEVRKDALDAFKDVVCALQWLTAQITGIKRGDALLPTEQDFQRDVNSFNKFAAYFTKCLNNLEK